MAFMNLSIYYFSGTGNSLKITKDLTEKFEDSIILKLLSKMQSNLYIIFHITTT